MNSKRTIRALLAGTAQCTEDEGEMERMLARAAWAKQAAATWREAQRAMDERCTEAVDRLDEEEFERLFQAEQAKVDAVRAPMQAVIDHDRWPRHLHFKAI